MQKQLLAIFLGFSMLATQASFALTAKQTETIATAFKSNSTEQKAAAHDMAIVYGGEDVANFPLLSMNTRILA